MEIKIDSVDKEEQEYVFKVENEAEDVLGRAVNLVQYYEMSVKTLRIMCRQRGISPIPRLKIDLILALEKDDAASRQRNLGGINGPSQNYS